MTDRELFIGGRFTSIDGDPARFQRYQDVRDGLLFSGFRYAFAAPDGGYDFHARANNVGWRIDYHIATPGIAAKARTESIYKRKFFSDHAPLTIDYEYEI